MTLITPDYSTLLNYRPWNHQLEALRFVQNHRSSMLAMAVGTGKSMVVVGNVMAKAQQGKAFRTLIVCKKSMLDVWPEEFVKHANKPYAITTLPGHMSVKKREALAKETLKSSYYLERSGIPTILVTNLEAVWRSPLGPMLKKGNLDMTVVDESQNIKGAGAKSSRYMHRLGKTVPFRMALTGTPLHNTPLDAYGQFRYLDDSIFGTSFDAFRMEYAELVPGPSAHVPLVKGYKNLDQLAEKMSSIVYSVDQSVLNLPPEVYTHRYGVLPPKQQKLYDSLDKDFIAWLDKQATVAPANVLTKLLRLQQLANGFLKDDEGEIHHVSSTKIDMLYDTLAELPDDEPVVIFTKFVHDIESVRGVAHVLGREVCELSGQRNELKQWQQEGAPPIIAVQIQAGGSGVDLTRSKYCIYYTMPTLGDRIQTLGRAIRSGQTRNVTVIDLIVKGTIDEKVAKALELNADVVNFVITEMRKERV